MAGRGTAWAGALVLCVGLLALVAAGGAGATPPAACGVPQFNAGVATVTCAYTGAAQSWTVPAGVTSATFTLDGASGGTPLQPVYGDGSGGKGGEVVATLAVTPGDVLEVNVGGAGGLPTGGFNGGGAGSNTYFKSGGGGGASDVRTGAFGLADIQLSAGGGGGGATSDDGADAGVTTRYAGNGGDGGATPGDGTDGLSALAAGGGGGGGGVSEAGGTGGTGDTPGTAGSAGTDGQGGEAGWSNSGGGGYGGGGGGGWKGGGGGGQGGFCVAGGIGLCGSDYLLAAGGGGGGGTSYATGSATGVTFTDGAHSGDGQVTIQYSPDPAGVPHITSFTPAAAAGATVTLTGTHLDGALAVDFAGAAAPATITSDKATMLKVTVPPDATVGPIEVTTSAGAGDTSKPFKPLPKITSLSALDGDPGNEITITGTNLENILGVKFGTKSTASGLTGTPAVTLRAIVPSIGFSSGRVTVITTGGTAVSAQTFTITKVTGVSPPTAAAGKTVTITGQGLASTTAVDFFGHNTVTPASVSATAVKVVVPDDALPGVLIVHTPNTTPGPSTMTAKPLKVAPTITSVTPLDGIAGTPVTITGTGFFSDVATVVKFGTVALGAYSVISPTEIDADIPAGFSSGKVSVTTPGGGTATSKDTIAITKITGFTPAKAKPGTFATPAGATVTITGQGLGSTTQVDFAGSTVPFPIPALATILSVSPTAVKVSVPAMATQGPITLVTPATGPGGVQSAASFTPLPVLDALTPTAAGLPLIVNGAGFEPTGVAPVVKLGSETLSPFLLFNTTAFIPLPSDAITGMLTVTTPAGTASAKLLVPPTISSAPGDGAAGSEVTLSGLTFTGTTKVTFTDGVSVPFKVTGALGTTQTLTFKVPATAKTGPITVTNAGGSVQSSSFTVDPAITSFTPSSAAVGAQITVKGTGLYGATLVTFGGGVTATPSDVTPTSLRVVVPQGVDAGPLVVHTDTGGDSPPSAGTFTPTATLASFSPAGGAAGKVVTLHGSGFTNVTDVKFDGVSVGDGNFEVDSATTVLAIVPAGAGDGPISIVRSKAPTELDSAASFSVLSVTSLSSTSVHEGDTLTIDGTHLGNATQVTFGGGATATPSNVTSTSFDVVVPAGVSTGTLTVTTSDFGTVTTPSLTILAPAIDSFSVTNTDTGWTLHVVGAGFAGVSAVDIGAVDVTADSTVVDAQHVDVAIPAANPGGDIAVTADAGTTSGTHTLYMHFNGLLGTYYDGDAPATYSAADAQDAADSWGGTGDATVQCSGEDALFATKGGVIAIWVYGSGALQGDVGVGATPTCPTDATNAWS